MTEKNNESDFDLELAIEAEPPASHRVSDPSTASESNSAPRSAKPRSTEVNQASGKSGGTGRRPRGFRQWSIVRFIRKRFWLLVLMCVIFYLIKVISADFIPLFSYALPDSEQLQASPAIYFDRGLPFKDYAREYQQHLRQYRLPVAHQAYSEQVQLSWVAPFTQTVTNDCRQIRGRALLIHGLYGSAYQMHDTANALAKACIESDVMLLPGHGTRAADLTQVSAEDYLSAVRQRIARFRESCHRCYVVGYSLGGLLASMILIEDNSNIDGAVFIAPSWDIPLRRMIGLFDELLVKLYPYSPYSRSTPLPTHYNFESLYAVTQVATLVDWFHADQRWQRTLDVPSLVVIGEKDEVVDLNSIEPVLGLRFARSPSLLLYTDFPAEFDLYFEHSEYFKGRLIKESNSWSDLNISSLSHFGMVYSPFNFLYGFDGIYGSCMEPAGFDCANPPLEIEFTERKLTPRADQMMTPSHPEFDRMLSIIRQFLAQH